MIGPAIAARAMLRVEVKLVEALDLCDPIIRSALGVSLRDLHGPWLREQSSRRFPLTQRLGEAARSERFEAIIAPSTADKPSGRNLVIIPETMRRTSFVRSTRLTPAPIPFTAERLVGRLSR